MQGEESENLREAEEAKRLEQRALRCSSPLPPDLRRLCFKATDIVHYISTVLPGKMYTSSELCQYARDDGELYFAKEMYLQGYSYTTDLTQVIALTYTWSNPIPHALQYIYDMICKDRYVC